MQIKQNFERILMRKVIAVKVLIADNDQFAREGIANSVDWARYGFETVYMAKNGLEVLSTVQMTQPDLVITEAEMPYLDGIGMIEKLRSQNESICFIVVSGRKDTRFLKAAIHLNVFEYILKPININELVDAIQRARVKILREKYGSIDEGKSLPVASVTEYKGELSELENIRTEESLEDCDIHQFADALQKGNVDGAMAQFARKRQFFAKKERCSSVVLHMLCHNFMSVCDQELKKQGGSIDDVFEFPIATIQNIVSQPDVTSTLALLERAVSEMLTHIKNLMARSTNTDIEKAREYISRHYSEVSVSLNEVAKQVNMNPAYFSVLFKRDTGVTFINYLTDVRIERSKELLAKTNMKIYEIAYAVGYDNPTYFSTVFKKITNYSPQDYRKNKNLN